MYKPLSYGEVLERTGSERIETTIRKRQLGFAGVLIWQGDSRLSKRVMFGRLAVQGPKREDRPATSWMDCLQKNLEAFGAVPRKGKGRKFFCFFFALFIFCFLIFSSEPLPGDDVLCGLLPRPLPSVFFLPSLFFLFCFLRPCSFPVCSGPTPSIL